MDRYSIQHQHFIKPWNIPNTSYIMGIIPLLKTEIQLNISFYTNLKNHFTSFRYYRHFSTFKASYSVLTPAFQNPTFTLQFHQKPPSPTVRCAPSSLHRNRVLYLNNNRIKKLSFFQVTKSVISKTSCEQKERKSNSIDGYT